MQLVPAAARPKAPADLRTLELIPAERTMAFGALRRTVVYGSAAAIVLVLGATMLLFGTVIAGAVIAHGTLVVESGAKRVQHPTGGVVAQILVKEDDVVRAGQTLVVLDGTVDRARVSATAMSLVQQRARLVRLLAERDGLTKLTFAPYDPAMVVPAADYEATVGSERLQFQLRRENRDGQRSQLRERVAQAEEEVRSNEVQLTATLSQKDLVEAETSHLRDLFSKQLVPAQRLSEMERTLAQLIGSEGALRSSIAQGKGKVAELEQMVIQVDQSLRAELTDQIAAAQGQVAELTEQLVISQDQLRRSNIIAPQDGVVHQLAVHTVGGVVQGAETLMAVVPEHDRLVAEIKLSPNDIDQLFPGQEVTINFSAFDRGTTPAVTGHLSSISPDLVTDPQRGVSYYLGRVEADDAELAKLPPDLRLVPGMPVETFVKTDSRTIYSYLMKPLLDQLRRAFR